MKAKELRIGNWVNHSNSAIWIDEVKNTPIHVDIDVLSNIQYYEPIPLSPEMLENCEQLKADNYGLYFFKDSEVCCKLTNGLLEIGMWNYENEGEQTPVICELKYVHSLQNCYYALTQTELNIKL